MKKYIFILTIISAFLTSCSSEDLPTTAIDKETTYPITFKIANPLSVEGVPFRSVKSKNEGLESIEMRIFNEIGDCLTFLMLNQDNKAQWLQPNGSANIELSLPKGNYILNFFTVLDSSLYGYGGPFLHSGMYNYFEFYVPNEGTKGYYESLKINVAGTNETVEKDIVLKAMWSNVNITLEDAQTFSVPEGTDALRFDVSPLYTGFNLDTKLATVKAPDDFLSDFNKSRTNLISLDSVRLNPTYTALKYVYQTLPENGNLAIKVNYLKTKGTTEPVVLKTRELQIPDISIENGYNYNISGKLDVSNGQSMNISLGEFNKEDVVIEF